MTVADRLFNKLIDPFCSRWCPVCDAGRLLMPGYDIIECWNCGVANHCDNWYTAPQNKSDH